ncbi:MAG: polysaccharide biosynthesis C-terminal domain-containing protein [Pseudomonadota bacterium]|nr:polysaccharide biosynthesis C-terminal domain-containing protein [Pseudomonadota bacterium]
MVWIALFVLLGRLAGAAKEMAIAYRYGVSAEVDAYLYVLTLVTWPVSIWFSVLVGVLVPLAARIRHDSTTPDLPRLRAELFGLSVVIGLALATLAWLILPAVLRAPWTGLSTTTAALALETVPVLLVAAPIGVVTSLFSAWMLAAGRHANTLLEGVPALTIALSVVAFSGAGVEPLVWGTLAGFAFHLISLAIQLARHGEIEVPRFTHRSPHWATFWQGFGISLAGQALMSLIGIIDQLFAAHLGTGAIATLGYANRVLALILGLGATAVSRATLPIFSNTAAQGGVQRRRLANQWVLLLFTFGVLALIAGWELTPLAVRLLFERGAFMAEDTLAVSEALRAGLLQVPFYFAGIVLAAVLLSQQEYKLIALSATINLIAKVGANLVLVPLMGVSGINAATAFMYLVSLATLWWFTASFTKRSVP